MNLILIPVKKYIGISTYQLRYIELIKKYSFHIIFLIIIIFIGIFIYKYLFVISIMISNYHLLSFSFFISKFYYF